MTVPWIAGEIEKNSTERVIVALDEFGNHDLIDVRVHGNYSGESYRPTRKGISLRIAKLPSLIAALVKAKDEAERRGLLQEAAR